MSFQVSWLEGPCATAHPTFHFSPVAEVEEALSLEADAFEERYGVVKPTQDTDIIFHCRGGVRSLVAMDAAFKLGYPRYVEA